jgi:3'(2'), 5'-bisphosphate nucleotidase
MYERELEIATQLALRAGAEAVAASRGRFAVEEKGPGDLVTSVDKALNTLIVEALGAAFPDDAIVAEESVDNSARGRRTWFVDPIDGTKDFVNGTGEWSVMIGLAVEGRPAVGVVYHAVPDRLYAAALPGSATLTVGGTTETIRCSARRDADALVAVRSANHPDRFAGLLSVHVGVTNSYPHGSLGCKLVQIAEGRGDLYGNGSGKVSLWDTCAGEAILIAAGGRLVTARGEAIDYNSAATGITEPFLAFNEPGLPAWMEGVHELL